MADPTKLVIQISTPADITGAKATDGALKGIQATTKAAASSTQDQAKATNELGETFEKGAAAGRVLGEVSGGNILAIGQLGAVFKAVGAAFRANPLFLIGSLAASLVLPVIAKIGEGWEAQKKKAEEAGKASVDAAGAALEAIEKKRQNASEKYFNDIGTAADAAKAKAEALDLVLVAINDRNEAVALAKVDADEKLSDREKLTAKLAISREARSGRDKISLDALDREQKAAADLAVGSAAAADTARAQEASSARVVSGLQAQSPAALREQLKQAQAEEKSAFTARNSAQDAALAGIKNEEELSAATARFATARQRRADIEAALSTENQTKQEGNLKNAEDALKKATDDKVAAEKKAAADAAAFADKAEVIAAKKAVLTITADSQKKVEDITLPAQLKQAGSLSDQQAADAANRFGGLARNVANGAGADNGLKDVSNVLSDAVKAVKTDGSTKEEVQALLAAAQDLARELAARKAESALLNDALRTLTTQMGIQTTQMKTLRGNSR